MRLLFCLVATVHTRTTPINGAPKISYGSMMIDRPRNSGNDAGLILSPQSRNALLAESPHLRPFIRRLYGGEEFLNATERGPHDPHCLAKSGSPLLRTY